MRLIDADELKEAMEEHTDYKGYLVCDPEEIIDLAQTIERPQGTCKTCKYYVPFREQFSNRQRGDGYCKSTITNAEGQAYINCHDEWYCANYEKGGDK